MNNYFKELIIPYEGTQSFRLGAKYGDIKKLLKGEHLRFRQIERSNRGCEVEWPWIILIVEESISLVFVKDILFEIVFEGMYSGKLANGACLGISLKELETIDDSLEYNDFDEDYSSSEGYWVTDDELGNVNSITVFVKEIEESNFYKYEWLEKYL